MNNDKNQTPSFEQNTCTLLKTLIIRYLYFSVSTLIDSESN